MRERVIGQGQALLLLCATAETWAAPSEFLSLLGVGLKAWGDSSVGAFWGLKCSGRERAGMGGRQVHGEGHSSAGTCYSTAPTSPARPSPACSSTDLAPYPWFLAPAGSDLWRQVRLCWGWGQ